MSFKRNKHRELGELHARVEIPEGQSRNQMRTNLMATVCELSRFVPARKSHVRQCSIYAGLYSGSTKRTFEDDTERAFSDFLPYAVVNADDVGSGRRVRVRHGSGRLSSSSWAVWSCMRRERGKRRKERERAVWPEPDRRGKKQATGPSLDARRKQAPIMPSRKSKESQTRSSLPALDFTDAVHLQLCEGGSGCHMLGRRNNMPCFMFNNETNSTS